MYCIQYIQTSYTIFIDVPSIFHGLSTRPRADGFLLGELFQWPRRAEPKPNRPTAEPKSRRQAVKHVQSKKPRRDLETFLILLTLQFSATRLSNSIPGELLMLLLHASNHCSNKLPLGEVLNIKTIKMPYVWKTLENLTFSWQKRKPTWSGVGPTFGFPAKCSSFTHLYLFFSGGFRWI